MSRGFDATVPNPARMWNYWLGGKDNFAADRAAGDRIMLSQWWGDGPVETDTATGLAGHVGIARKG